MKPSTVSQRNARREKQQTTRRSRVNHPEAKDFGVSLNQTYEVRDCATYIFFHRMLKDINHGMGEAKIDEMITRSIRIAQMLHKRLYE